MPAPARLTIPRGLTSDPDMSLHAAVQRCVGRPLAHHVLPGYRHNQHVRTLVYLIPGTDHYVTSQITRHDAWGWERGVARLSNSDLSRQSRAQTLTRRREALRQTLDRLPNDDGLPIDMALAANPEGSFCGIVGLLWWVERVHGGMAPGTAWVMLGLRVPSSVLRWLRFDHENGVLHSASRDVTLHGF